MSEISSDLRNYVNSQLRKAALVIDTAEHSAILRKGDSNFMMAAGAIRGWRRLIDETHELEQIMRALKELDQDLSIVSGSAADAVQTARQIVGDTHFRLATTRADVPGGINA